MIFEMFFVVKITLDFHHTKLITIITSLHVRLVIVGNLETISSRYDVSNSFKYLVFGTLAISLLNTVYILALVLVFTKIF